MDGGDSADGRQRTVSRRRFVEAAGATGVTAGLAGCTSLHPLALTEDETSRRTIRWAADSRAADNADALRQAMWDAGLPQDIYVEIVAGATQTGARQSQYQRWLSADLEEPDMLLMDSGWALTFIQRDQLLNLDDNLPSSLTNRIKNEYFEASVNTATGEDGSLYAMPLFPDFPTMQYRKDLVREAGYDPDGNNWATETMDWQRFSEVTADVMEQTDTDMGFTFQADNYEGLSCCDFNEFMTSFGGAYFGNPEEYLFGPIGDRPVTVDEDPVVQATQLMRTFINGPDAPDTLDGYAGPISPQGVLGWAEEPSRRPFTSGDAVMHRNWPYSIVINGAEDVFGEDLGVMPIPYGVTADEAQYPMTGGPVAALGGWHMTINPNSEKIDMAIQVFEAMAQQSFKLSLFETIGWIPPEPSLLDTQEARDVPIVGRYIDALKVAGQNAIPRPATAVWPLESTKIAQRVHAALTGQETSQEALGTLKSELEQIEQFNAVD
ncbi:substrate-binding domain-containing protein [Halobium salinum]|uniref:Substrate-binding domain-containing protein n=1 Tax=Halobium salinum TaxID=1364940 RepID=A0ABD5P9G8_9EURY|nr:substrate-binding domain-containing protein [Halobium salinum]